MYIATATLQLLLEVLNTQEEDPHWLAHLVPEKTNVRQYTLNLAEFLKANNYEPFIIRALLPESIQRKGTTILIDFSGCLDLKDCDIDAKSGLMEHLKADVKNFTNTTTQIPKPMPREKSIQILSSFSEAELRDICLLAHPIFKKWIRELFPAVDPATEKADPKKMQRRQAPKTKTPNKRAIEGGMFLHPDKLKQLKALEQKYQLDHIRANHGPTHSRAK